MKGAILILGGTGPARELANALAEKGHLVVSSLAGVTANPLLPMGEVRRGGFGGVEGLAAFIAARNFRLLIDATHPFAETMSMNACAAAQISALPLLRLELPAWQVVAGDIWLRASNMAGAIDLLPASARVLVTTGRKGLRGLFERQDLSGVVRCIEAPTAEMPPGWGLLLDRPPYTVQHEIALMQRHGISHVLSKNAGGESVYTKIAAARQLGLSVIMLERPVKPACMCFTSPVELVVAVENMFSQQVLGRLVGTG